MKFTFLSVNMKTLYITIFNLSRAFFYFGDMLLIIHTLWKKMTLFQIKYYMSSLMSFYI